VASPVQKLLLISLPPHVSVNTLTNVHKAAKLCGCNLMLTRVNSPKKQGVFKSQAIAMHCTGDNIGKQRQEGILLAGRQLYAHLFVYDLLCLFNGLLKLLGTSGLTRIA
jgi:hypothetical protein